MSEHDEQKALFDWAASMIAQGRIPELENMFAIPNGGQRNKAVAVKLKQEGVKKGVLDIFLAMPIHENAGLFIEMKFTDGRLSSEQKEWLVRFESAGFQVRTCWNWVAAAKEIILYLGKDKEDFSEFFE